MRWIRLIFQSNLHFFCGFALFMSCVLQTSTGTCGGPVDQSRPLAVRVGELDINLPTVSITICANGTQNCQSIDKIKLDTGSAGLRLSKSALNIALNSELDSSGRPVFACQGFGGGTQLWGPVQMATVQLGSDSANNVPVQIFDPDDPKWPASCPKPTSAIGLSGANGLLGIGVGKNTSRGTYFVCESDRCTLSEIPENLTVLNPVVRMPKNHDGVTLTFPAVPASGATSVVGTLSLGVASQFHNAQKNPSAVCKTDRDGFILTGYGGARYWAIVDSGANSFNLPNSIQIAPKCAGGGGYLCPTSPVDFMGAFMNPDGNSCADEKITFTAFDSYAYRQGHRVFENLAEQWGGAMSDLLSLGMPFFYGRTIYFVIDGQPSPFGKGPLVAF